MTTFTLPKIGETAEISILKESEMADVLALQDASRAALPEDKKCFILPQSSAYFQNLLTRQTGLMVGIRTDGKLIAQMALYGPVELREAIALHLITRNDVTFHHAALAERVVIFKSMVSHPDWRGNDLGKNMLEFAMQTQLVRGADHVFAQVSSGNKRSWDVFARAQFGIVAAAVDPEDGMPRFIFQKPAFGFDFSPEISADDVDPVSDFSAIVTLTQREALVGVYGEHAIDKLIFLRSREATNLMPTIARVKVGV
jgi:GNAT superfamily N-acetyltransferase